MGKHNQSYLAIAGICVFIIASYVGCVDSSQYLQVKPHSKIIFSKDLISLNQTNKNILYQKTPKILAYLDGDCSKCISRLKLWQDMRQTEKDWNDVSFVAIIYGSSFNVIEYLLNDKYTFDFPIFFEPIEEGKRTHELSQLEILEEIEFVLIDKQHEIQVIGAPMDSKTIKRNYKSKINELASNL